MPKPLPDATLYESSSDVFQGGNAGSNPAGDAKKIRGLQLRSPFRFHPL